MNQFLEWMAMGGYSLYVWPAYSAVFFVLIMNVLGVKWKRKQTRQKLQQWFER